MEQFARVLRMLDSKWLENLQNKKVVVFGLGGVGSYVVEALVRCGIGEIVLVDHDKIDITNLNRQLPITASRSINALIISSLN